VEEKYIKVYSEVNEMRFKLSEYEARMAHSEEMLDVLKHATNSEISDRIIEMSDKMSQIRKSELQHKREAEEYGEKLNYSENRISQQKRNIVDMEETVAELEAKMHRKEEEWRRADNERQKKFFDAQFVNFETENRYKGYVDDSEVREKYKKETLLAPPAGEFLIKKEDVRIMQAKLRNQEDEISNLRAQIISKEKQLDRLREWQLEDNLLSEDEKLRDIIDSNKVKIDQMHEKETVEMAQAATKTISMLKELVENKTSQIKRKEEIINDLKNKLIEQAQQNATDMVRLGQKVAEASKAQSDAEHTFHKTEFKVDNRAYEANSRNQLVNLCMEKDREIQDLADKITELERAKRYLLDTKDDQERERAMRTTDAMAGNQSKKVSDLRRHIDILTKKLESKEKVQDRLNDTIKEITDKLIKLEQAKGITDEDVKMDRLTRDKDKTVGAENPSRIEELEKMLRQKERRLITTTQKSKLQEKELRELKEKLLKMKEIESDLREEVKNSLSMRQKLIDQYEAEKREVKRKERLAKKEVEAQDTGKTSLELRAMVKQVSRENKVLKTQTKPIIAYNSESKAFEYIGEPAPLKNESHPCESIDELLYEIKEWLKINDRLTVPTIFNNFDYNKSGFIEKELLIPIFARLGIKLHEKEINMLFNCLNKEDEFVCKYRPLVVELTTGPRQLEFIHE
jgi:hypothetical protein